MSEPSCGACRFWVRQEGIHDEEEGQCFRYPPTLNPVSVGDLARIPKFRIYGEFAPNEAASRYQASWALPVVPNDHFCGEFQPKPCDARDGAATSHGEPD